ncbi:MAG: ABC transporter permease [Halobacteriales archaeon]|nr:ABC transporter permease [Halobacteriales archaeon]
MTPRADQPTSETVDIARRRSTDVLDRLVSRAGLASYVALVMLFLWLPMFVIVLFSFSGSGTIHFPPRSFSLDYYIVLFFPDAVDLTITHPFDWGVVTNSLIIGSVAATVVVILGILGGYTINNYDLPLLNAFQSIALLPIIVPLIVTAIGLVIFFSFLNINTGLGTTIIAHIVYTFPFGIIIITSSIARVDPALEDAASDLGSTRFRVFRKVTLPLIYPGVFAAWILAFTLSLNEFVITFFVSGTFLSTLPTWMWDQLRFGVSPLTYVVSALTLFAAIGMVLVVHRLIGIQRVSK